MKAINIQWETDGQHADLPNEIELPEDIESDDYDAIDDYLSNVTGFLHNGYELESEKER